MWINYFLHGKITDGERMSCLLRNVIVLTILVNVVFCDEVRYVLEGQDVTLGCQIPRTLTTDASIYWMGPGTTTLIDNYAIGNATFNKDYRVDYQPNEGRYDLTITRATYDRNNGMFMCKVKQEGTGADFHSSKVNLTVLIKPGSPNVTPVHPTATQGLPITLTCSSKGGSPDPEIRWYRASSGSVLRAILKPGGGRDYPTTSQLTLKPDREDDGEELICEVSNRALEEGEKMAMRVQLNVNYYPIVRISPSNPVRAIRGQDVKLECSVDAKPKVQNVRWLRRGQFVQTQPELNLRNVDLNDAGRYICQADNGLGRAGEAEITLDVLYPPTVTVPDGMEVELGQDLIVRCNVTSNPSAGDIYWTKFGSDDFEQKGSQLILNRISAEDHGEYVCHAISDLSSSSPTGEFISVEGNATLSLYVKHPPGKSYIIPANPVAVVGKSVVLTCGADLAGYPNTLYRWWRSHISTRPIEMSENYSIPIVSQIDAGMYHCQPFNEVGNGSVISVSLRVFEKPVILEGLKPSAVYTRDRTDLKLSCRAMGKPKPLAKWYKDGEEVYEEDGWYSVKLNYTSQNQGMSNSIRNPSMGDGDDDGSYLVQSTLSFKGPDRMGLKALRPEDRGRYECSFENEAEKVSSTQLLRVQHPPSVAHRLSKVASSISGNAQLICKMRAFPKPLFQWIHNHNEIRAEAANSNSRVSLDNSDLGDDLYLSVLTIRNVNQGDYGAYTCKALNDEGPSKTIVFLQAPGEPDPPTNLSVLSSGTDHLKIGYERGFDGGFPDSTNVSVLVSWANGGHIIECGPYNTESTNGPFCSIDSLKPNTQYELSFKAMNALGTSMPSATLSASTLINSNSIPAPMEVYFETDSGELVFTLPKTDAGISDALLTAYGRMEVDYNGQWTSVPSKVEIKDRKGRFELGSLDAGTNVRLRLCLQAKSMEEVCGGFREAKHVNELPIQLLPKAGVFPMIVGILVSIALLALLLLVACCCCRYQRNSRLMKKTKELEVEHRGVVNQQAPPPPYYTVGMENKGMSASIDHGLEEHNKQTIYGHHQQYQNFGHGQHHNPSAVPGNQGGMPAGYLDNSYSNSNNGGGSVNSQDSLWQLKHPNGATPSDLHAQANCTSMMPIGGHTTPHMSPHMNPANPHNQPMNNEMDMGGYVQYNPIVHGGYGLGGHGDYAHYQQQTEEFSPNPVNAHDYNQQHHNSPSKFNGGGLDPYGVLKNRGVDTIDDGYDVSGVPNPYQDSHSQSNSNYHAGIPEMGRHNYPEMNHDSKPQINFDESLESGFSTPNSRNRRVIREIIV